jgi:hypothetical protein
MVELYIPREVSSKNLYFIIYNNEKKAYVKDIAQLENAPSPGPEYLKVLNKK